MGVGQSDPISASKRILYSTLKVFADSGNSQ